VQQPLLSVPGAGASFDIGALADDARAHIPLAEALPVVVRTSFVSAARRAPLS
jgi:hypothetical protein